MLKTLNGHLEPGRSIAFWLALTALVAAMAFLPMFIGRYALLNLNSFLLMTFLAAGLALLWGYGGVLSLGQSAFFGIGGYAYGIVGINFAGSDWASLTGLAASLIFTVVAAAALSWLVFYGRLRGVYVGIVTLVVTLLIESFLNQTAGPQWKVGAAHLGGNNGLGRFSGAVEQLPTLAVPFGVPFEFTGSSRAFYYLLLVLIVVGYLALRTLVNSRFGIALTAVREDPDRAETLGYDVRLLQAAAFCIGAFLAALSGILYVSWGNFITPSVFGVTANILPVIWVAVAGRKSIAAAIIGAVILQWGAQKLALQGEYALIVQGFLLVLVVLAVPEGVQSLGRTAASLMQRTRPAQAAKAEG
ncbi:MAG TPA: branched-chain amino acid ABC transporter permease [Tianweitania sediminis]|nr:branched-chain amino acid ABC transporter permease [Tianweitania sediminis]